ncbi:tetratricopeptide repeat protein, partial [Nocardia sp. NPDC005998]|uniref:ATP-binding protein n=1 Tax=Nocardia sp. NPDC005998 TaxID=3156894 RepID=UPI0033BB6649
MAAVTDDDLARVRTHQELGNLIRQLLAHAELSYRKVEAVARKVKTDGKEISLGRSALTDICNGRRITEDKLRLLLYVCGVPQEQVRKWLTAFDHAADQPIRNATEPSDDDATDQHNSSPPHAVPTSRADFEVGVNLAIHAAGYAAVPERPVVTTALRRDVTTFLGRCDELQRIVDAVEEGRAEPIYTIDGMPGIGKTALVTRAAHRLTPYFPDGQYFVELHAHTPGRAPADSAKVLAELLIGLGVDPRTVPDTLQGRRDMWRNKLTGKSVLLVLDDARDHDQVEPLLPASAGCLTLITSRSRLVALDGATPLVLKNLDSVSAADLFITLAGRTATETDRAAVDRIVRLCGYLPLAIVVLAGRLAHHPVWSIPKLADEFAATADRLTELGTRDRAVRAAFVMSYKDLPADRQRLFRYLGLHPGADINAAAAAALADIPVESARSDLEALYTDHLLDEANQGRYTLHDLLRVFAGELAAADPPEDSSRAINRMLDYYQRTVRNPPSGAQAGSWIRSEHANLIACFDYVIANRPTKAIVFGNTLASVLVRYGPWPIAVQLYERTHAITRDLSNELGEARILTFLGLMQRLLGNFAEAAAAHLKALAIYRKLGDQESEALTVYLLGIVRTLTKNHEEASALYNRALDLYRQLNIQLGEALILDILGTTQKDEGNHVDAIALYQQALAISRRVGDRTLEAHTTFGLGEVYRSIGNDASILYEQAIALYGSLDHQHGVANVLCSVAAGLRVDKDYAEAINKYQQALAIYRSVGDQLGEANTLYRLGDLQRIAAKYLQAAELLREA